MNIKELLSPDVDLSLLQAKAEELFAVIEVLKKKRKHEPEGRLRIAQRPDAASYFHVTDDSSRWGEYLPLSQSKLIEQLAQKEYEHKAIAELTQELNVLDRFLKSYNPKRIHDLYEKMIPARKRFVHPLLLPDADYAAAWQAVAYKGKTFAEGVPLLTTSRGERVRSKSEVIIADTLARLNVPYRYEFPMQLKVGEWPTHPNRDSSGRNSGSYDGSESTGCDRSDSRKRNRRSKIITLHPDFTCLAVRARKEFIWEHFGMMDDAEYAASSAEKLEAYAANGMFLGDRLLITMETQDRPLSASTVEAIAEKFLT